MLNHSQRYAFRIQSTSVISSIYADDNNHGPGGPADGAPHGGGGGFGAGRARAFNTNRNHVNHHAGPNNSTNNHGAFTGASGGGFHGAGNAPCAPHDKSYSRQDLFAIRSDMLAANRNLNLPSGVKESADTPEIWKGYTGDRSGAGTAMEAPAAPPAVRPPGIKGPYEKRLDKLTGLAASLQLQKPWHKVLANSFTYIDDNGQTQVCHWHNSETHF
jgi:hypothetical protein